MVVDVQVTPVSYKHHCQLFTLIPEMSKSHHTNVLYYMYCIPDMIVLNNCVFVLEVLACCKYVVEQEALLDCLVMVSI